MSIKPEGELSRWCIAPTTKLKQGKSDDGDTKNNSSLFINWNEEQQASKQSKKESPSDTEPGSQENTDDSRNQHSYHRKPLPQR
jgi:hypothetical protein